MEEEPVLVGPGYVSAINVPVACVTMVDAEEGDAYVVDLRVSKNYKSAKAWNRYIIDTGVAKEMGADIQPTENIAAGTRGGPRAGLYRAVFDYDIIKNTHHDTTLQPPWKGGGGELIRPIICGTIITHTDRDHWGNASWLSRYLRVDYNTYSKDLTMNPLPVYTSPMIQWAKDIADISHAKVRNNKSDALQKMAEAEDEADSQAKTFVTDKFKISFNKPRTDYERTQPLESPVKLREDHHNDLLLLKQKSWKEALKIYEATQLQLLAEKPYCALDFGELWSEGSDKSKPDTGDRRMISYYARWVHKIFNPTVGRSHSSIYQLAHVLGYALKYRFNFQTTKHDTQVIVEDLDYLMQPLSGDWIKAKTATKNQEWDFQSTVQVSIEDLRRLDAIPDGSNQPSNEVWVIAEVALIPPPATAKRSYKVQGSDPNGTIAGEWLRLIVKHRFVKDGQGSVDPEAIEIEQLSSVPSDVKLDGLSERLDEALEAYNLEQSRDDKPDWKLQGIFLGSFTGSFQKAPPLDKFVEDVRCLGFQDKIYGLKFFVEDDKVSKETNQIGTTKETAKMESFWKSTYSGCAGTRFSRDFLHMATQFYLSRNKTDHWIKSTNAMAKVYEAQRQSQDFMTKRARSKIIEYVLKHREMPDEEKKSKEEKQQEKERQKKEKKEKQDKKKKEKGGKKGKKKGKEEMELEDEDEEIEPDMDTIRGRLQAEKKILDGELKALQASFSLQEEEKIVSDGAKHSAARNHAWGHAANRSSLITHFCFDTVTGGGGGQSIQFDMLFTGDAFEIGAADSQPYANHLRPTHEDYQHPLSYHPSSLEIQTGLVGNPDGNLLSWLWQNNQMKGLRVKVLKLPHHGSSNTTSATFYRFVSASVYLVSGANSPHGHPRPETLQAIIETILKEDGPAKPPSEYLSVQSLKRAQKEKRPMDEVKKITSIVERPRPRLIFLTYNTCKEGRWDAEMREVKEKEFREAQKQAANWASNPLNSDPNAAEGDVEAPENEFPDAPGDGAPGGDAPGGNIAENSTPKVKRNYIDVQEFVYFYSRYLGGFADVPYDEYEKAQKEGGTENLPASKKKQRANVRIFVQKSSGAATRLTFGYDKYQPDQVRVEWHKEDWFEVRADKAPDDPYDDPVAYPNPGQHPDWEKRVRWNGNNDINANDNAEDDVFNTEEYLNLVPAKGEAVAPPQDASQLSFGDLMLTHERPYEILRDAQPSPQASERMKSPEAFGMRTFLVSDKKVRGLFSSPNSHEVTPVAPVYSRTGHMEDLNVKRMSDFDGFPVLDLDLDRGVVKKLHFGD